MKPGDVVGGRFEVETLAGAGGMGSVYRSRDRLTGEPVALKVLRVDRRAPLDRFAREGQLLAELQHPGVVRYVAHGRAGDGPPYLVMEWLEGEDLKARLGRGPALSVDEVVALGQQVGAALGAAHARGVVHRDVKPGNLFLAGSDVRRVKLLDFGIARLLDRDSAITRAGMALGTPGYIAPEQARGAEDVGAQADVFSLGCVLFECLAGVAPFHAEDKVAVLAKILLEEPPKLRAVRPDTPEALEALVGRMLAKEPGERPVDGDAVAAALGRLAGGGERRAERGVAGGGGVA
ncbi:serine/threonine-protein kinase, partial [Chondromyces apiculatus]|uniref:serine/threonine-protein kinase n=1 Tax=Chondromyces apiculatus TaxID=51 RepID=UPI0005C5FD1F